MKTASSIEAPIPRILTIGHSTRPIEDFLALLKTYAVTHLVDVRTIPRSRHNPQFNIDALPDTLKAEGIRYTHLTELGGLRHTTTQSINTGWRNKSFRGFADYMQTPEFAKAIDALITLSKQDRLAVMCAEAVPWRCHRSLIADALLVRGVTTSDIQTIHRLQPHKLTPFAKVEGIHITYPPEDHPAPENP